MSEVLTEILRVDPAFDKERFLQQCENDIIPNVLEVGRPRSGPSPSCPASVASGCARRTGRGPMGRSARGRHLSRLQRPEHPRTGPCSSHSSGKAPGVTCGPSRSPRWQLLSCLALPHLWGVSAPGTELPVTMSAGNSCLPCQPAWSLLPGSLVPAAGGGSWGCSERPPAAFQEWGMLSRVG